MSRRKKFYKCPAPNCNHKPFKTLTSQIAHSRDCRALAKPFNNSNRIDAENKIRNLRLQTEKNKKRAREHRVRSGKSIDSRFECPCCGDDFTRWSWKECSIAILKHYTQPNWRNYCKKFDKEIVLDLFRTHRLFRTERALLAREQIL